MYRRKEEKLKNKSSKYRYKSGWNLKKTSNVRYGRRGLGARANL